MIGKLAFATAALCALADEDGTALLQFRTAPGFQYPENAFTKPIEQPIEKPVQKGPVQCPGSGNFCEGNQCCPGHAVSGGKTFPCPNADRDFNRCEVGGLPTVLPAFVEVHIGSAVKCPGTEFTCAGNQCCPGIFTTQYKTFPCPTAERNYAGCNITLPYLLQTAPGFKFPENAFTKPIEQPIEKPVQKGPVQCPGSGNYCEGNQCCPGHAVSGGKTFPCPNADQDFNRCEVRGLPTVLPALVQVSRRQPDSSEEEELSGDSEEPEESSEDESTFVYPPNPFTFVFPPNPFTEEVEEADEIAAAIVEGMEEEMKEQTPADAQETTDASAIQTAPGFVYPENAFTKPAQGPVKCFGSENYCEGNQCCPGHKVTGGKSFPCANADADFNGCETKIRPKPTQNRQARNGRKASA